MKILQKIVFYTFCNSGRPEYLFQTCPVSIVTILLFLNTCPVTIVTILLLFSCRRMLEVFSDDSDIVCMILHNCTCMQEAGECRR